MRIMLIGVQLGVLSIMALIVAAAGGWLSSLPALSGGYGPAAIAGGLAVIAMFTAAAVGFVAIVLPLSLLAAVTLCLAVAAGYRPLRWTRVAGVFVNLLAVAVVVLPHFLMENYPVALTVALILYPCGNAALFLLLPRMPNVELTRRVCRVAVPCLYLPAPILGILVLTQTPSATGAADWVVAAVFLLLYLFPFYYAYRTLSFTGELGRVLLVRLGVLALMTGVVLLLIFPLGLMLVGCLFLLLALSELEVLYPVVAPPAGGARYWVARVMGRLPDGNGGV